MGIGGPDAARWSNKGPVDRQLAKAGVGRRWVVSVDPLMVNCSVVVFSMPASLRTEISTLGSGKFLPRRVGVREGDSMRRCSQPVSGNIWQVLVMCRSDFYAQSLGLFRQQGAR